jgi:hypothetical protein
MSLTDKIIEELRNETNAGGLITKDGAEDWATNFNRFAAMADQPFGAQRLLVLAVIAEVGFAFIAKFGMPYVMHFIDFEYVGVFGVIGVFFTGFFGAFAAYKLYKEYVHPAASVSVDDGELSGFADYDTRDSGVAIYVVSAAAGIANLLIILALFLYQ